MIKRPGASEFEYRYLFVDVAGERITLLSHERVQALISTGHPRIYLENAEARPERSRGSDRKFLGVKWG
jgi:hypothetical protein